MGVGVSCTVDEIFEIRAAVGWLTIFLFTSHFIRHIYLLFSSLYSVRPGDSFPYPRRRTTFPFSPQPLLPKPWDGRGTGEAATPTAADVQVGLKGLTRMLAREVHNLTEVFSKKLTGKLRSLAGLASLHVILVSKKIFTSIADGFFKGPTALTAVNLDENPLEPWMIPSDLVDRESLLNFSINSVNLTCALPEFIGNGSLLVHDGSPAGAAQRPIWRAAGGGASATVAKTRALLNAPEMDLLSSA
ncbi:uncharacterized protein LOC124672977 [Lolium rigidum]|uniref:uncharacterized protein LOC124672977 n=1 Tax=Lolium rigidum TaxID=89674 RepID=UPI001F5C4165|nr:uncharacterized protein LOC124672977 [Lolium rigidum]